MERVKDEPVWLFCPNFADEFVGCETFEGLEPSSEIVGRDEVGERVSKLVMSFVVEPLDRCVFDCPVHAFDLTVCPRMLGFCEAMIDIGLGAYVWEGMAFHLPLLATERSHCAAGSDAGMQG